MTMTSSTNKAHKQLSSKLSYCVLPIDGFTVVANRLPQGSNEPQGARG